MHLTQEQQSIIQSQGNIKVSAVAGSGKTTTIISYAQNRPKSEKMLYLAFNNTVKIEAINRFKKANIHNVIVETAHSLAYKYTVNQARYSVASKGYRLTELATILGLDSMNQTLKYRIMNYTQKLVSFYCNSDLKSAAELDFQSVLTEDDKKIIEPLLPTVEKYARLWLTKMNNREMAVTHDFYLKKFQLITPKLPYDYIFFDEAQDASGAMLDVFIKQMGHKVIVGDPHQQIYHWRYAINAMESLDFETLPLSQSFRFNGDIAKLAEAILKMKDHLTDCPLPTIKGSQIPEPKSQQKAVLGRSNLGLLLMAIEYIHSDFFKGSIYLEGNIHAYTFTNHGISLYEVLALFDKKNSQVKDPFLKNFSNFEDLETYSEESQEVHLKMMIELVKTYKNSIHSIIKQLQAKIVDKNNITENTVIFSTVHQSKGLEYDHIMLLDDFISEETIKKKISKMKLNDFQKKQWLEEINLLYVAITRTKHRLFIPSNLLPDDFPHTPTIRVLPENRLEGLKMFIREN